MPLSKNLQQCSKILTELMKAKDAEVFNEPVDFVAYGLLTYPEIIKQPMDMGTIKVSSINTHHIYTLVYSSFILILRLLPYRKYRTILAIFLNCFSILQILLAFKIYTNI